MGKKSLDIILDIGLFYRFKIRVLIVILKWKTVLAQGAQKIIGWIYSKIIFYIAQDYSQKYRKILKKSVLFLTKHTLRNIKHLRMSRGRLDILLSCM